MGKYFGHIAKKEKNMHPSWCQSEVGCRTSFAIGLCNAAGLASCFFSFEWKFSADFSHQRLFGIASMPTYFALYAGN